MRQRLRCAARPRDAAKSSCLTPRDLRLNAWKRLRRSKRRTLPKLRRPPACNDATAIEYTPTLLASMPGKRAITAPCAARALSNQRQLTRGGSRRVKQRHVVRETLALVQAETCAGCGETFGKERRVLAFATLAVAEARIVVAAATHRLQARHHVTRLERFVLFEPLTKQVLELVGQAQQHEARRYGAGLGGSLQDALEL